MRATEGGYPAVHLPPYTHPSLSPSMYVADRHVLFADARVQVVLHCIHRLWLVASNGVQWILVKEEPAMVKRARLKSGPLGHAEYLFKTVCCAAQRLRARCAVVGRASVPHASRGLISTHGVLLLSQVSAPVRASMAQQRLEPVSIQDTLVPGWGALAAKRTRTGRAYASDVPLWK